MKLGKHYIDNCDLGALLLMVAAMGAILLSCAGCGHNVIQYGDGVGFDAGINPENFTMSFNLRYGKILSAVTRDNVEIEMSGKANADGSNGSTEAKTAASSVATDGALKVKIGRQINGAAVDLVKAGADKDKVIEILKAEEAAGAAKTDSAAQTPTADNNATTTKESEASK